MKSRLFKRFDPKAVPENRFANDMAHMLSLSPEQWEIVVEALPTLLAARTPAERKPIVTNIEDKTGVPSFTLSRICSQAQFFLRAFHTDDRSAEAPSLWAEDLDDAKMIRPEDRTRFVEFMSLLKKKALEPVETLQRQRFTETGVLPSFTGSGTTVELRGVFEEDYKYGSSVDEIPPQAHRNHTYCVRGHNC